MTKTLSELISTLPDFIRVNGDAQATITAPVVEADSDLQPGGVFVARPGLAVDGHDFIPRAIEKGAAAVVGEREISDLSVPYVQVKNAQEATGYLAAAYHDFPSRKLVVIGVTGTDGKTTTSTLIHSILQVATGGKAGLISTVNAVIGDQQIDTGFHVTTPSAPMIQSLLAQMVANGLTHCVLEMTSHGLAQGRLNGVDVDVAVMTNVTHEHLDYHGSFEAYRAAKGRMFEMLGKSYRKKIISKHAIINLDDPNALFFLELVDDDIRTTTTGYTTHRNPPSLPGVRQPFEFITLIRTVLTPSGMQIRYSHTPDKVEVEDEVETSLIGLFNVKNVLAAVAVGQIISAGESVARGIKNTLPIPGRMERIDKGQDFTAIVDFAHTPNALRNALQAGREMLQPGRKLIAVFGSAGLRDREKRRLMAEVAAELADFTILTAEDPRTESLDAILDVMAEAMVTKGGVEGKTFIRVRDRGEALYQACQMAGAGDILMACGKGHEQSMCFGTVEYPWDDREALRAALRGEPLRTLPTAK